MDDNLTVLMFELQAVTILLLNGPSENLQKVDTIAGERFNLLP